MTVTLALSQMQYQGVLLGPTTPYGIEPGITGLLGLADNRNADVSYPNRSGLLAGYDFPGGRTVTFTVDVAASVGFTTQQNLDALQAALQMNQSLTPGFWQTPALYYNFGEANGSVGVTRFIVARVRKADVQVDLEFLAGNGAAGIARVAAQLNTIDPRKYDANIQSQTVGLVASSGGWVFPWVFPWVFGSSSGGFIYATNAGNSDCPPLMTLTGPATNPRVQAQTTGQTLALNYTMAATDVIVLDCANQIVTLNGAYRNNLLAAGSQWFTVPAGASTFGFYSQDASPTAATLTVEYTNAWQ